LPIKRYNYSYKGKGSLVLSYGVTNSGKTYTILGTEEQPGLLPNIISKIEK
jgi:kinesin family protein 3/17